MRIDSQHSVAIMTLLVYPFHSPLEYHPTYYTVSIVTVLFEESVECDMFAVQHNHSATGSCYYATTQYTYQVQTTSLWPTFMKWTFSELKLTRLDCIKSSSFNFLVVSDHAISWRNFYFVPFNSYVSEKKESWLSKNFLAACNADRILQLLNSE